MNTMKIARDAAGFSQKEVAITLSVSAPTISEWESGRKNPNATNLKALAKLYNVSSDYLLGQSQISTYTEGDETKIIARNPISILSSQYHAGADVLASIFSASPALIDEWILGGKEPGESDYEELSRFFEIPVSDLKRGALPLFPRESVQLKLYDADSLRFAAHGKGDGDFTPVEIESIELFKEKIRNNRMRRKE